MKNNKFSYVGSLKICEQALDMIDIEKYLINSSEPLNIMKNIENDIQKEHPENLFNFMEQYKEIFDKSLKLFNYMTDLEFVNYCKKRYPNIKWGHQFVERFWVINDGTNT